MHTLGFLGSFDSTLCPAKYNYGQTLANLSVIVRHYLEHCVGDDFTKKNIIVLEFVFLILFIYLTNYLRQG